MSIRGQSIPLASLALPLIAITVACLMVAPADAQERPGTLSIGIQGQYGIIGGASDFAELYNAGAGFAFRIRYALGGPQAIGISFEQQTFKPDKTNAFEDIAQDPRKLSLANVTIEYLRYFNRGTGRSQYVVGGLGLYHPSDERVAGLSPASDGAILLIGGGIEIFALRATSVDISARANALLGSDAVSTTLQIAIGFHHYLVN